MKRRTFLATVRDLSGLIEQGTRLLMTVPLAIIEQPVREKSVWRSWAYRVSDAISKQPISLRSVPPCHTLGARPQGYDWSKRQECGDCSVKLTCILSSKKAKYVDLRVPADDSLKALSDWTLDKPVKKKNRKPLIRPNPDANYHPDAIWGVYPSGILIPKIYPQHNSRGKARLYLVEMHRVDHIPYMSIERVYSADSAVKALNVSGYRPAEHLLEKYWNMWDVVEADAERILTPASILASGHMNHIVHHIKLDIDVDEGRAKIKNKDKGNMGTLFFRLSLSDRQAQERHAYAKKKRREGLDTIKSSRRLHKRCRACARLRKQKTR